MRRLASFVAIVLLLITAAPVLACVTGSAMSHEEIACCRAMHGNCGEMAKMGCCRVEFRTGVQPQLAVSVSHPRPAFTSEHGTVTALTPRPKMDWTRLRFPDEHSPPGLMFARITVLRI